MYILEKIKALIIILIFVIFNIKDLDALENKILFKIDNQIITTIDIYEEIKFLKTFNPQINNLSDKELLEISKNSIIKNKIKKIEIMNYVKEIKVENKFLLNFIKNNYSQIGLTSIETFENYLNNNDLSIKIAKEKIATELIWNDIIFQKFSSKINIDKEKIKNDVLKNQQKKNAKRIITFRNNIRCCPKI